MNKRYKNDCFQENIKQHNCFKKYLNGKYFLHLNAISQYFSFTILNAVLLNLENKG